MSNAVARAETTDEPVRTWALGGSGFETLALQKRSRRALKATEVRIAVRSTSLNYRDLMIASGNYGRGNGNAGLVPLSDGAGQVVEIGEDVRRWRVGDRVAATFFQDWPDGEIHAATFASALGGSIDGMLAEEVVLHEGGLVRVPEHLSYAEAAALPCAAVTAWNALITRGRLRAGETVLVQGTGGVSLFALAFAKAGGATVIATTSSDDKAARLRQLGAEEVVDYKKMPEWQEPVLELTGGRVSLIGVLTGVDAVPFNSQPIVGRSICVQGIYVGSRADFDAMNRAMERHAIRPVIDRVFPFDQALDAYRHFAARAHVGKVVIGEA